MIRNSIHYISMAEAENIKLGLDQSIFIVEMDGMRIQTEEDYLHEAWTKFKFPYPNETPSWPGYNDWICDLDWLNAEGYALFIYNRNDFFQNEKAGEKSFISGFKDYILPFWEEEVTRVVVDGKAKPFNVYLVD